MIKDKILHPKYRSDIDGLRAIAVLSVVIYHAFPDSLRGGFAGVDVFFVISGFLISTILFQNIDHGTFSIRDFYSRRIRRIFPALAIVLFSVLIAGWFCLFPDELSHLGKHIASSAGFIQNFTLWKESGYFDIESETKPLLHIWSLGIEEQFYFVWPLLLLAAGRIGGRHKKMFYFLATFLVFAVSFALNVNSIEVDPTKTFYLPQYRFWELAVGGILSWIVLYESSIPTKFQNSEENFFLRIFSKERCKEGAAFLGLVVLLHVFDKFNKETVFPGINALIPVSATAFIIFAGSNSFINRRLLSNKILVWFGLISFPLYLWHWPILSFARIIYGGEPSKGFRLLAVAVSILLSWLTVKVIENPFRFGNKNTGFKVTILCLSVFVIGISGYLLHLAQDDKILSEKNKDTMQIVTTAEQNCEKKYPKWNDQNGVKTDMWCRLENESSSIALVGDSHSGHLYYGFIDALKNTKESVANFQASCSAPLLNVSTGRPSSPKYKEDNAKLMNMAFDYIGKTPSVHTVYLAHSPDCSFYEGSALDLENPNEKNTEVILRNGLVRTLSFLSSKNKNVVIVLDNPTFPFIPNQCKSRGSSLESFRRECQVEIKSPSREQYKKIVNEIVSTQFPKVKVLDLTPLFCSSGKCSPIVNGKMLYIDSGHLNTDGSVFVSKYLLKAMR